MEKNAEMKSPKIVLFGWCQDVYVPIKSIAI